MIHRNPGHPCPALTSLFWFVLVCLFPLPCALAGTLTLDQAFDRARAGNPTIKAMVQRIYQARETVVQARAAYYPEFTLTSRATQNRAARNESDAGGRTQEAYDAFLTGKWIIFQGFARTYDLAAARMSADQEAANHQDLVRRLLASVAQTFHKAQLALANQRIAGANQEFYAIQLKTARIKHQAGVGSLTDVLNIHTRMNQASIEKERYQAEYDVARAALTALLGGDAGKGALAGPVFPADETGDEMAAPDPFALIERAMANRPDLKGLGLAVRIADADAEAARSRFYPELSLKGSMGADRTGNARFGSRDIENSVGIEFSYPLYRGGQDRAALKRALYARAEADLDLRDRVNQIISEVRQDCFSVSAAQRQLRLYRENGKLVKQNRDMVEKEYQFGKTSLVTLNEVQNTLTGTRQRIALSLISLRQAWYELKASSGDLGLPLVSP